MLLNIPDSGLALEGSAKAMAGLPTQAFGITLSDSVIEDMIKCVQDGQGIQLSLGSSPAFSFDGRDIKIPSSSVSCDYDLFHSSSATPTAIHRLPQPTMSILRNSKPRHQRVARSAYPAKADKADKALVRTPTSVPSGSTPRLSAVSDRDVGSMDDEAAIANLKNSYAKVEAEKRENASTLIDGILPVKGPKGKQAKGKLLGSQITSSSRSHPGSPAFAPAASPSLAATTATAQDRLKQQRFPVIHELAVDEHSFDDLKKKWDEGTEEEFRKLLDKVADFNQATQKWQLKRTYWKELDVQEYDYASPEDRQKAIDNAVRQYDRMRIGVMDPLWQKLLPKAERNKGICLSKVQAAIANKASAPKINVSKTDASSVSGADSEKDDSTSSGAKKGKGGEPMSRSNSQTLKKKPSASEAQAKRLLSNSKKPVAPAKASPKVSPTKPTTSAKSTSTAKNPHFKSKEFISDSDSDDDEVPLSNSMAKPKTATATVSKPAERGAEKARLAERTKDMSIQKTKPTLAARPTMKEKEKDTIRAQLPAAKPGRAPVKRQREADEDDSSSSGAPLLNKRMKTGGKTTQAAPAKQRTISDASQNSRATASANSFAKSKNTSPVKSSPLATSPPTNASQLEQDRTTTSRDYGHGRDRARYIDRDHDTIVSRAGSSTGSSTGGSVGSGPGKKRPADDLSPEGRTKRSRLSAETLLKANAFKQRYSLYEALHKEIRSLEAPSADRLAYLLDEHENLQKMKDEIYNEAIAV